MSLFRSLGRRAEQVKRSVTGENVECPACAATVEEGRETCPDCGTAVERSE